MADSPRRLDSVYRVFRLDKSKSTISGVSSASTLPRRSLRFPPWRFVSLAVRFVFDNYGPR